MFNIAEFVEREAESGKDTQIQKVSSVILVIVRTGKDY